MSANAFQQLQDLLQEIEAANPANAIRFKDVLEFLEQKAP
jgi:hypothetical protein